MCDYWLAIVTLIVGFFSDLKDSTRNIAKPNKLLLGRIPYLISN